MPMATNVHGILLIEECEGQWLTPLNSSPDNSLSLPWAHVPSSIRRRLSGAAPLWTESIWGLPHLAAHVSSWDLASNVQIMLRGRES